MRILISIGPTETMHFKPGRFGGNAPPRRHRSGTGVSVTFPDLEVEDELFARP